MPAHDGVLSILESKPKQQKGFSPTGNRRKVQILTETSNQIWIGDRKYVSLLRRSWKKNPYI
jgi:hypothetical protein